jgi:chromosomal replication initiation ATPase DnaA
MYRGTDVELDWVDVTPRTEPWLPIAVVLAREAPRSDSLRGIIEQTVTFIFDVVRDEFHLSRRGRANVALARQTGMYVAHVAFSLSYTQVGLLFERDRTTVAHACAVIEDRRDDPDFDRVLDLIERAVMALHLPRPIRR